LTGVVRCMSDQIHLVGREEISFPATFSFLREFLKATCQISFDCMPSYSFGCEVCYAGRWKEVGDSSRYSGPPAVLLAEWMEIYASSFTPVLQDVDAKDSNRWTPLHSAAVNEHDKWLDY
jgi:hypothetical protein